MASISPEACAGALLACCLEGRPWRENDLEPLLSGEHGHLLFSVVAEGLADRFEPRLCNSYAALFSEVIARKIDGLHAHHLFERYQRVRKPREFEGDPSRVRNVFVLSRVTLGPDIAVTSVLLDAARRKFPEARAWLVGSLKSWELFSSSSIGHIPITYRRGGSLESRFGVDGGDYRYYVDTGPVLERGWAERAGLGFTGKNAMLISRTHGNWLCLAAILTRVPLVPDAPLRPDADARVGLLCGKCTRCLDACPTRAFAAPGVVDARRCVSYQTIENKGAIPRELRAGIGARIYGCDVCAEVCPWNRFAQAGRRMLLKARGEIADLSLPDLLALTPERFAEAFRRTPIKRVKLGGLLRNACIVAGNSGDATLLPALVRLASHELALVRAHAVWAVYRLAGGTQAAALLAAARGAESDPGVLAEYAAEAVGGDGGCAPTSLS